MSFVHTNILHTDLFTKFYLSEFSFRKTSTFCLALGTRQAKNVIKTSLNPIL